MPRLRRATSRACQPPRRLGKMSMGSLDRVFGCFKATRSAALRGSGISGDHHGPNGAAEDPMERGHQIDVRNTAFFRHDYEGEHADLRRLYEQAKLDQWNAATDIDWDRPLAGDGGVSADAPVGIHGTRC